MAFQKPIFEAPKCPNCDAQLVADGKRPNMYKCPNWKPHDEGCKGLIWFKPDDKPRYNSTGGGAKPSFTSGDQLVLDEVVAFRKEFNERMDAMAAFLAKQKADEK